MATAKAEPKIVWIKKEDGTREEWVLEQPEGSPLSGDGQMRRVLIPNHVFQFADSLEFKEELRHQLNEIYEDLCAIHRRTNS